MDRATLRNPDETFLANVYRSIARGRDLANPYSQNYSKFMSQTAIGILDSIVVNSHEDIDTQKQRVRNTMPQLMGIIDKLNMWSREDTV